MPDVYEEFSDEYEFVEKALKNGVPTGRIEFIMMIAAVFEKKPLDLQKAWMDAHVGIQQVFQRIK